MNQPVDGTCAGCLLPLSDAVSLEAGLEVSCRIDLDYRHISSLGKPQWKEAQDIIYRVRALQGDQLQNALLRLVNLGFDAMAKRFEKLYWRRATVAPQIEVQPAAAPTPQPNPVTLPFQLTEGQERGREMIKRVVQKPGFSLGVLAGFAGTGKTTLIKIISMEWGTPIVVTPTGKAALRVRESTGLDASTIHRWMYTATPDAKTGIAKFARRHLSEIPLTRNRMVVIDESSMVGPDLWKDIYLICRQLDLKLVCIGDGFQLPPIVPPNTPPFSLLDPKFVAQHEAERMEMTEIVRQAQDSPVIRASMALRNGAGLAGLRELPRVPANQFWLTAMNCFQSGGVTICHKNATRFQINAGMRAMFGFSDEAPRPGEPLLVLRNNYNAGVVNGETIEFSPWERVPEEYERVHDNWNDISEDVRFGSLRIGGMGPRVVMALEEIHGRTKASSRAIENAAARWARINGVLSGDEIAPHLSANFGYALTAHKSQGSEWPFVFVAVEPSIRLNEEEGCRWLYTAITRSSKATALYVGRV